MDRQELEKLTLKGRKGEPALLDIAAKHGVDTTLNKSEIVAEIVKAQKKAEKKAAPKKEEIPAPPAAPQADPDPKKAVARLRSKAERLSGFLDTIRVDSINAVEAIAVRVNNAFRVADNCDRAEVADEISETLDGLIKESERAVKGLENIK